MGWPCVHRFLLPAPLSKEDFNKNWWLDQPGAIVSSIGMGSTVTSGSHLPSFYQSVDRITVEYQQAPPRLQRLMDETFASMETTDNAASVLDPVLRRGRGRPAGSHGAAGLRRDLSLYEHALVTEAARNEPEPVRIHERTRSRATCSRCR